MTNKKLLKLLRLAACSAFSKKKPEKIFQKNSKIFLDFFLNLRKIWGSRLGPLVWEEIETEQTNYYIWKCWTEMVARSVHFRSKR
jgi:hypothetical protein